jgi:hypothetical protein
MHHFPPAAEMQFLVGDEISQIRLDPYDIQFLFSSGTSMTVEWRIEHIDVGGVLHSHDCTASTGEAIYLHQMLQQPVSAVDAEPLCLTLTFKTGAILRVFTETGTYECGQIFPSKESGRGFIVF